MMYLRREKAKQMVIKNKKKIQIPVPVCYDKSVSKSYPQKL